jgi:hypothetical protein
MQIFSLYATSSHFTFEAFDYAAMNVPKRAILLLNENFEMELQLVGQRAKGMKSCGSATSYFLLFFSLSSKRVCPLQQFSLKRDSSFWGIRDAMLNVT